jgi:hypothetical protein
MPEASSLIQMLLARLERISADSPLAHRASGVRGALLRSLEDSHSGPTPSSTEIRHSIDAALDILGQAAASLRHGRGGGH